MVMEGGGAAGEPLSLGVLSYEVEIGLEEAAAQIEELNPRIAELARSLGQLQTGFNGVTASAQNMASTQQVLGQQAGRFLGPTGIGRQGAPGDTGQQVRVMGQQLRASNETTGALRGLSSVESTLARQRQQATAQITQETEQLLRQARAITEAAQTYRQYQQQRDVAIRARSTPELAQAMTEDLAPRNRRIEQFLQSRLPPTPPAPRAPQAALPPGPPPAPAPQAAAPPALGQRLLSGARQFLTSQSGELDLDALLREMNRETAEERSARVAELARRTTTARAQLAQPAREEEAPPQAAALPRPAAPRELEQGEEDVTPRAAPGRGRTRGLVGQRRVTEAEGTRAGMEQRIAALEDRVNLRERNIAAGRATRPNAQEQVDQLRASLGEAQERLRRGNYEMPELPEARAVRGPPRVERPQAPPAVIGPFGRIPGEAELQDLVARMQRGVGVGAEPGAVRGGEAAAESTRALLRQANAVAQQGGEQANAIVQAYTQLVTTLAPSLQAWSRATRAARAAAAQNPPPTPEQVTPAAAPPAAPTRPARRARGAAAEQPVPPAAEPVQAAAAAPAAGQAAARARIQQAIARRRTETAAAEPVSRETGLPADQEDALRAANLRQQAEARRAARQQAARDEAQRQANQAELERQRAAVAAPAPGPPPAGPTPEQIAEAARTAGTVEADEARMRAAAERRRRATPVGVEEAETPPAQPPAPPAVPTLRLGMSAADIARVEATRRQPQLVPPRAAAVAPTAQQALAAAVARQQEQAAQAEAQRQAADRAALAQEARNADERRRQQEADSRRQRAAEEAARAARAGRPGQVPLTPLEEPEPPRRRRTAPLPAAAPVPPAVAEEQPAPPVAGFRLGMSELEIRRAEAALRPPAAPPPAPAAPAPTAQDALRAAVARQQAQAAEAERARRETDQAALERQAQNVEERRRQQEAESRRQREAEEAARAARTTLPGQVALAPLPEEEAPRLRRTAAQPRPPAPPAAQPRAERAQGELDFGGFFRGAGELGLSMREADLRRAEARMAELRTRYPTATNEQVAGTPLGQTIERYRQEIAERRAAPGRAEPAEPRAAPPVAAAAAPPPAPPPPPPPRRTAAAAPPPPEPPDDAGAARRRIQEAMARYAAAVREVTERPTAEPVAQPTPAAALPRAERGTQTAVEGASRATRDNATALQQEQAAINAKLPLLARLQGAERDVGTAAGRAGRNVRENADAQRDAATSATRLSPELRQLRDQLGNRVGTPQQLLEAQQRGFTGQPTGPGPAVLQRENVGAAPAPDIEGRLATLAAQFAGGSRALAQQLGVTERTVQRWLAFEQQGGTAQARNVALSPQAFAVRQLARQQEGQAVFEARRAPEIAGEQQQREVFGEAVRAGQRQIRAAQAVVAPPADVVGVTRAAGEQREITERNTAAWQAQDDEYQKAINDQRLLGEAIFGANRAIEAQRAELLQLQEASRPEGIQQQIDLLRNAPRAVQIGGFRGVEQRPGQAGATPEDLQRLSQEQGRFQAESQRAQARINAQIREAQLREQGRPGAIQERVRQLRQQPQEQEIGGFRFAGAAPADVQALNRESGRQQAQQAAQELRNRQAQQAAAREELEAQRRSGALSQDQFKVLTEGVPRATRQAQGPLAQLSRILNDLFGAGNSQAERFIGNLLGISLGISIVGTVGKQIHAVIAGAIEDEANWQRAIRATNAAFGDRTQTVAATAQALARNPQIVGTRVEQLQGFGVQQATGRQLGVPLEQEAQLVELSGRLGRTFGAGAAESNQAVAEAIAGDTQALTQLSQGLVDLSGAGLAQRVGLQRQPDVGREAFGQVFDLLPEQQQTALRLAAAEQELNAERNRGVDAATQLANRQEALGRSLEEVWNAVGRIAGQAATAVLGGVTGPAAQLEARALGAQRNALRDEILNQQGLRTGGGPLGQQLFRAGTGGPFNIGAQTLTPQESAAAQSAATEQANRALGIQEDAQGNLTRATESASAAIDKQIDAQQQAETADRAVADEILARAGASREYIQALSGETQALSRNQQELQRGQVGAQLAQQARGPFGAIGPLFQAGIPTIAAGEATDILSQMRAAERAQQQGAGAAQAQLSVTAQQGPEAVAPGATRPAVAEQQDLDRIIAARARAAQLETAQGVIQLNQDQTRVQLAALELAHAQDLYEVQDNGLSRAQQLTQLKISQLQVEQQISDAQLEQTRIQNQITVTSRDNLDTRLRLLQAQQAALGPAQRQQQLSFEQQYAEAQINSILARRRLGDTTADLGQIPGLEATRQVAALRQLAGAPEELQTGQNVTLVQQQAEREANARAQALVPLEQAQRDVQDRLLAEQLTEQTIETATSYIQRQLDLYDAQRQDQADLANYESAKEAALEAQVTYANAINNAIEAGLPDQQQSLNYAAQLVDAWNLQEVGSRAVADNRERELAAAQQLAQTGPNPVQEEQQAQALRPTVTIDQGAQQTGGGAGGQPQGPGGGPPLPQDDPRNRPQNVGQALSQAEQALGTAFDNFAATVHGLWQNQPTVAVGTLTPETPAPIPGLPPQPPAPPMPGQATTSAADITPQLTSALDPLTGAVNRLADLWQNQPTIHVPLPGQGGDAGANDANQAPVYHTYMEPANGGGGDNGSSIGNLTINLTVDHSGGGQGGQDTQSLVDQVEQGVTEGVLRALAMTRNSQPQRVPASVAAAR